MIVENAQVVALEGELAIVQNIRRSACSSCEVHRGCGMPLLNKIVPNRLCNLPVVNTVNAVVGDTVQVGLEEGGLLKASLMLYASPLLSVIAGVTMAMALLGPDMSDFSAILSAVVGFILGLSVVRGLTGRMSGRDEYQARILSIVNSSGRFPSVFYHPG